MSNKESFLEGRELESFGYTDMPTYEQVMNSHKPSQSTYSQIEALQAKIDKLVYDKQKLEEEYSTHVFVFYNPNNYPEALIKNMCLHPENAYYYIISTKPLFFKGQYGFLGDYWEGGKAVRNPFYIHGEITQRKMEKDFYE